MPAPGRTGSRLAAQLLFSLVTGGSQQKPELPRLWVLVAQQTWGHAFERGLRNQNTVLPHTSGPACLNSLPWFLSSLSSALEGCLGKHVSLGLLSSHGSGSSGFCRVPPASCSAAPSLSMEKHLSGTFARGQSPTWSSESSQSLVHTVSALTLSPSFSWRPHTIPTPGIPDPRKDPREALPRLPYQKENILKMFLFN